MTVDQYTPVQLAAMGRRLAAAENLERSRQVIREHALSPSAGRDACDWPSFCADPGRTSELTPEQIAEFEAECDRHQLRLDHPMPAPPSAEQAVEVVRHALVAHATTGGLACTAEHAAAHAVQALRGAWVMFVDGPELRPHADCAANRADTEGVA